MTSWRSASDRPDSRVNTSIAVRMRGTKLGETDVVEVDGFYLNEFGLFYDDGCECFEEGENPAEQELHDRQGCPHTGFYHIEDDGEEAPYLPFNASEWHELTNGVTDAS